MAKNILTGAQRLHLCDWLRMKAKEHEARPPTISDVEREASAAMGFRVLYTNIRSAKKDCALTWKVRKGVQPRKVNPLNRALARFIVESVAPALEINQNELDPLIRAAAEESEHT